MGRILGDSVFPANFELRKAAPIDSRLIVDTVADLTELSTWDGGDGNAYVYKGMVVSVVDDGLNNGLYVLKEEDYTEANNWEQVGTGSGGGEGGSGEFVGFIVEQADHGFNNVAVYYNDVNEEWELAKADDEKTLATHFAKAINANQFTAIQLGKVDLTGVLDEDEEPLTPKTVYFLSQESSGKIVKNSPYEGYRQVILETVQSDLGTIYNDPAMFYYAVPPTDETINFNAASGVVYIPSGLPIGVKRLVRKIHAGEGQVDIEFTGGESVTREALTSVTLTSDGDFWLLEKVTATRWELVVGNGASNSTTVTEDYTTLASDDIINVNNSSEVTISIGDDYSIGKRLLIRKVSSDDDSATVEFTGGESITKSALTRGSLTSDGDFIFIEKVSASRWELLSSSVVDFSTDVIDTDAYLAVAHHNFPRVTIYKQDLDTFDKLDDPEDPPTGLSRSVAFSADGNYLSAAHDTTPFISIYKRNGDTFDKLDNPTNLPPNYGQGVAFSPDGTYLAGAIALSLFLIIYKRNGDTFTKLDDPSDMPPSHGRAVAFSPDGVHLAVVHHTSPWITIYKRSGDTFTKLPTPEDLPDGGGFGVSFSADGNYLAAGHGSGSYVTIYKRDGDDFDKLPNPEDFPDGPANAVAFSPDSNYLAAAHDNSPSITIYKRSGDTFTRLPNPTGGLPVGDGEGVAFSANGNYLAVSHTTDPYITIYKRSGDTFTKLTNPEDLPEGRSRSVAFFPTYGGVGGN